ncbi:MAG: hypothetical protein GWN89_09830, partial [Thermoplasmata archaeon]|nr:hypothetical protein [Thermoplasmata archaeon]NIT77554.1 hypothetical protein [Thermoplasmata archaeon]NIU49312.1 hypothetical protein [Thermoplasmata archaeon]NIY03925.1 hypothetical protein [Thermoplasmata archaeon]
MAGGDPATLFDERTAFSTVVSGTMTGFGWGIEKLATGVGGLLWLVDRLPGHNVGVLSPYDYFVNRHRQGQADDMRDYEQTVLAETDEEVLFRATHIGAEQAWDEERRLNSQAYNEAMQMASGDETLAAGLFIGAILDSPEVINAAEQIVTEVRNLDERFYEDLREQDFRFSHEALDVMAMWGRNGPGRIATAVTLLLTDQDHWDNLTAGNFRQVWDEVGQQASELDFTPSRAVGIDGSMAGLTMDLGMGVFFDPTTYFLGPKFLGAAKGALMGTVKNGQFIARSPVVRGMVDDIINFAQSPMRNGGQLYKVMSWLDDTAIGEILNYTGLVDNIVPRGKWADNPMGAQEVSLEFIEGMIEPQRMLKAFEGAPEFDDAFYRLGVEEAADLDFVGTLDFLSEQGPIRNLGESITSRGFDEAAEFTINRADNTITFTDGVKRFLAARSQGIKRMPVRLRITDDASAGKVIIEGFDEAQGSVIQKIAKGDIEEILNRGSVESALTAGSDLDVVRQIKTTSNIIDQAGLAENVGSVFNKEGKGFQVWRHSDEGKVTYYAKHGDEIVGGVTGEAGKVMEGLGISMGLDDTARGIMSQIWDIARENGDEFILQSGLSPTVSEDA